MTQNNERELLLKVKDAICMAIYSDDGLDWVDGENLIQEIEAVLSPISQNEQQQPLAEIEEIKVTIEDRMAYNEWCALSKLTRPSCPISDAQIAKIKQANEITSPPKQAIPEGWVKIKKDAERYRWLREVSRDPDESSPHCVVTEEVLEKGKPAKMVSYLVFDEKLDAEIDKMINAAPTNTEVGE